MPLTLKRMGTRALVPLAAAALAAGCATNPVTGKPQLALISESQEIEMGRQAAQEVEQTMGLVNDQALQAYVQRVGEPLAKNSQRPNLPWQFRVVEDPTPNAFALPGGFIFVTRGLMDLMDSEAELATVLGHEIGHVTARHSVSQISRAELAQLGLGIGSILSPQVAQLGNVASTGLQLLFLKNSRDAERQADELGFGYAKQQGYDVQEMADVFVALQRIGEKEGQSPVPNWLSTHPAPPERIQRVQQRLAKLQAPSAGKLGAAEYLGQVDGLVYGDNPRNGFFRNGVFYHPDLRFRLTFPQGWKTQNLPQAVVAASPQGDAVIQFTLAGQPSAGQAAQQFLSQQGIQAGPASRENINGNPAVVGLFQAQTQQGVIQGTAAFIEYGGHVYQLLAYTPASRYGSYDNLFRQVVGSFSQLTDPQILAVQPNRVDVVRLDRAMTLTEFNRRYPSVIPLDELAIINQVEGPNSQLASGMLVKRVVAGRAG